MRPSDGDPSVNSVDNPGKARRRLPLWVVFASVAVGLVCLGLCGPFAVGFVSGLRQAQNLPPAPPAPPQNGQSAPPAPKPPPAANSTAAASGFALSPDDLEARLSLLKAGGHTSMTEAGEVVARWAAVSYGGQTHTVISRGAPGHIRQLVVQTRYLNTGDKRQRGIALTWALLRILDPTVPQADSGQLVHDTIELLRPSEDAPEYRRLDREEYGAVEIRLLFTGEDDLGRLLEYTLTARP